METPNNPMKVTARITPTGVEYRDDNGTVFTRDALEYLHHRGSPVEVVPPRKQIVGVGFAASLGGAQTVQQAGEHDD